MKNQFSTPATLMTHSCNQQCRTIARYSDNFLENSVLNLTHEEGRNKLAFLVVQIEIENNELKTSVYVKATGIGELLNFKSECLISTKSESLPICYIEVSKFCQICNFFSKKFID